MCVCVCCVCGCVWGGGFLPHSLGLCTRCSLCSIAPTSNAGSYKAAFGNLDKDFSKPQPIFTVTVLGNILAVPQYKTVPAQQLASTEDSSSITVYALTGVNLTVSTEALSHAVIMQSLHHCRILVSVGQSAAKSVHCCIAEQIQMCCCTHNMLLWSRRAEER